MITDPTADFLIRIKNGYLARRQEVEIPYSRQKFALCQILKEQGKIGNFSKTQVNKPIIKIKLKYIENQPPFSKIKIFSKPGQRIYWRVADLVKKRKMAGIIIISTSAGLKTLSAAIKEKLGGEVICQIE